MAYTTSPIRVRLCALLVVVSLLAACTPAASSPTPEPKGGGGEFRVLLAAEPKTLNPDLQGDDIAYTVAQNLFNKLVTLDADYRLIPDLAESWDISDDGLTYTFHLAGDVQWHDGAPFTSADVKWTFAAIASGGGIARDAAARIVSIDTPDAATVVMRLKEPWSPFLPTIAWVGTFILPAHLYQGSDWSQNPANEKPVGTGPFKFVAWAKGQSITLKANPDYFRRGPYLDQVTFLIPKDPAAAIDMLLQGEVDHIRTGVSGERIRELEQSPGVEVRTFPHPARFYCGFNLRRAPYNDLRVRQAINMAVNREELVDRALLGYGSPGYGFYTPAVAWAYNPEARAPAFDPAGAEELLDQAGVRRGEDGVRLRLTLVTLNFSPFTDISQVLVEQLRNVGLEAEVVSLASADWTTQVIQEHDFDLAMVDGTQAPDPENLNFRFGSQGGYQFMGYASQAFDAAVAEGARLSLLKERAQAYFRAQEILARDLPLAPLLEFVQFVVFRDPITGLPQTEARGLVTFQDYSLVRLK